MAAVLGRTRRRWWIAVVASLVASLLAMPGTALANDQVTFDGSGWGHGVGMSQYGTQSRALDGQTHEQILEAYYTGATVGTLGQNGVTDVDEIFVGVASDQIVMRATVRNGPGDSSEGVTVVRGTESASLLPGQWFEVRDTTDNAPGGCEVLFGHQPSWGIGSCNISVPLWYGAGDPSYLVELGTCRLSGNRCRYGWGNELRFVDNAGHDNGFPGFDVVVEIDVDQYARGIDEVPYLWHPEALKTQAVAARSYAASKALAVAQGNTGCFCDVRNDSFDQVYAGWVKDRPNGVGLLWDAAAVATAGQVVTHPSAEDRIVRAFYSSSNGGASESSKDKWNDGHPDALIPYLSSVPDQHSLTPANPFASWTVTRPRAELASWLGLADVHGVTVTARNDSGSPREFTFTGFDSGGGTTSRVKHVDEVRRRFNLRSWYFDIVLGLTTTANVHGADSVGLHDPNSGIWHLRNSAGAVSSFYYGNPADIPYAGDWNGDGTVTLGLYRQSTGFLFLRNSNSQGVADIQIFYGNPGDRPVAGDWNGDGTDTVGIFRPSEARFYLRNTNTQGVGDVNFPFGEPGDVPIAGDWNGDGIDTIGVYRPSNKTVYLANSNTDPKGDVVWVYEGAAPGDRVVAGDWNGDGIDTIGVFRPSEGRFYLRDDLSSAGANIVFYMGESFMSPIAGWWGS